jgi:magnesium-dependent phosphatase 1
MTNNVNWTAEETGRSQENRDDIIARNRWHPTPYVLFSRHPYMTGMPGPSNKRWSEMVVYTQIQRPLFEVVSLTDAQVSQITKPSPYLFDLQFKHWNILPLQETRQEFLRYGEKDLYAYSA